MIEPLRELAYRGRGFAYVVALLVLVEIVASTIFATLVAAISLIDGFSFSSIVALYIGLNLRVLAYELLSYSYVDGLLVAAVGTTYLVAISIVWFVARRLGIRTIEDVDRRLGKVRS